MKNMEASGRVKTIDELLSSFTLETDQPEKFLSVQNDTASSLKKITKGLYDLTKSQSSEDEACEALPELIIDNFDDEQVWQQIELQNDPCVSGLLSQVASVVTSKSLSFNLLSAKPIAKKEPKKKVDEEVENDSDMQSEEGDESLDEDDFDDQNDDDAEDMDADRQSESSEEEEEDAKGLFGEDDYNSDESEEEIMLKKLLDKAEGRNEESDNEMGDQEDDNDSDLDFDFETDSVPKTKSNKGQLKSSESKDKKLKSNLISAPKRKTVVDDNFFKLADMEAFLEREDLKEERKTSKRKKKTEDDSESEEEDEDFDVWAEDDSENEEGASSRDYKYSDFFDAVEGDSTSKKSVKFKSEDAEEDESDGESQDEDEGDEDQSKEESDDEEAGKRGAQDLFDSNSSEGEDAEEILGHKSSFEKRQERLKDRIGEMEAAALEEKPWQLMGESAAASRPQNALLEEDLEFEQQSRQAPDITEETTQALEDIIKQRIKDKAWDDVERKTKPTGDVFEYRKRIELDQEKSKLSLGEVYEQEYLKQQEKEEEEKEDPQREEIKKMMTSLFIKLDALSNFHYTPKPTAPDVQIINNMPSINMEEVQPVSVSDANMLAPHEVKEKEKQEVKGESEKTATDRLRARREKKRRQRQKAQQKERKQKMLEKANPGLGNKYAKERAMKDLEKQSKQGNQVNIIQDEKSKKNKNLTSSTQFFTQLQDEVKSQVHKQKSEKKKKEKSKKSSAKLKL